MDEACEAALRRLEGKVPERERLDTQSTVVERALGHQQRDIALRLSSQLRSVSFEDAPHLSLWAQTAIGQ